jgi:lipoprotein-anchoring transpeptidase ErfK/SrfK
MRFIRPIPRGVLAALAAVVVLAVVGVVVVAANSTSSSHQHQKISSGSSPLPAATLSVARLQHGRVAYAHRLRFTVENAALSTVKVKAAGLGALPGAFNATRTAWTSAAPLAPSSHLVAKVSYVNLAHHVTRTTLKFHTKHAKGGHFEALLSPGGNDTVGIASPVVVYFDRPIPDSKRAAVERGLTVKATPTVVGAWHWMSDQVVHWRPATYWKTGTKVKVSSNLQGVSIGHGVYGALGRHSTSFKIGDAHISEVDQATHTMRVYDNGKLIETYPVSTGRGQYPTMDGVHIALAKSAVIEMDSATVGIPKGNPDYYDETVYWDVRISNGGEFVHAAPWSVGDQGRENVSHGCVNLSTARAEWFYHWAQNGDVIDIYNGVRAPEAGDPGTADWNMSWKKWVAGDAAPTAAALALHPGMPRSYEPGFSHAKHHAAKHHAAKHHAAKHHAAKHHAAKNG